MSVFFIILSIFLVGALPGSNTNTLTITAASFQPNNSCEFYNSGDALTAIPASIGGCSHFLSNLSLPNGVTIEKITFFWSDSSVEHDAYLGLYSSALTGSHTRLINLSTTGSENLPSSSSVDLSITVDNYQYGYYLSLQMPSSESATIYGLQIEYSTPVLLFLPFIRRSELF